MTARLRAWLLAPVDAAPLALFRAVFGLAMVAWVALHIWPDKIWFHYIFPRFHFTYAGFSWVTPWSPRMMYLHFDAMALSALLLALGVAARLMAGVFFVLYSYVFLLEKTPYNNHHYLIMLLALLLAVVDSGRAFSVEARLWRRDLPPVVPRWQLVVLQCQLAVVYFFGGVAKLNVDWLAGRPLSLWLHDRAQRWPVGELLTAIPSLPQLMGVAGLVFDLAIAPLLWWRRTRPLAVVLVIGFHCTNWYLFRIGVFHALALFGTLALFTDPDRIRRLLSWVGARVVPATTFAPARPRAALLFTGAWIAVQVLVPLHHLLFPGNFAWTEEGRYFAWQIKARDKQVRGSITIHDGNQRREVDPTLTLNSAQIRQMYRRPDMLWQFAQHLAQQERARGVVNPVITAQVECSLNGRPYAPLIDPTVNLAQADYPLLAPAPWILPHPDEAATTAASSAAR